MLIERQKTAFGPVSIYLIGMYAHAGFDLVRQHGLFGDPRLDPSTAVWRSGRGGAQPMHDPFHRYATVSMHPSSFTPSFSEHRYPQQICDVALSGSSTNASRMGLSSGIDPSTTATRGSTTYVDIVCGLFGIERFHLAYCRCCFG